MGNDIYKKYGELDNQDLLRHILTKMLKEEPDLLIQVCLEVDMSIKSMQKEIDELKEKLADKDKCDGK